MTRPDESREKTMAKGADMPTRHRGAKPPRAETGSELPMVTALLVMAVLVAVVAAGGPVLDMLSALDTAVLR
jgi:hypothetical protein